MKYILLLIIFVAAACSKLPFPAPATPQTRWINLQTHKDTIITNVNNQQTDIYYAAYQWQQAAEPAVSHGYRFIGIRYGDSILVKKVNDASTIYDGPFLLQTNKSYDTLKAQNFLDTSIANSPKTYILLK